MERDTCARRDYVFDVQEKRGAWLLCRTWKRDLVIGVLHMDHVVGERWLEKC